MVFKGKNIQWDRTSTNIVYHNKKLKFIHHLNFNLILGTYIGVNKFCFCWSASLRRSGLPQGEVTDCDDSTLNELNLVQTFAIIKCCSDDAREDAPQGNHHTKLQQMRELGRGEDPRKFCLIEVSLFQKSHLLFLFWNRATSTLYINPVSEATLSSPGLPEAICLLLSLSSHNMQMSKCFYLKYLSML